MLFISYSRNNREFAEGLHSQLMAAGFSANQVFKDDDPRNGIPLGKDWERELPANVKGVTVLIVLVSPDWFASKWCFAELAMCKASPHNVRIIPFVLEDLTDEQWIKSGLGSCQRSNICITNFETDDEAIAAFISDLDQRGIRPESSRGRLVDSYPDSHSYRHRTYEKWGNDPNMQLPLIADQNQKSSIDAIRFKLGDDPTTRFAHLHVHGSSGVGKTRVVFEAMSDERFRSKVLYYDSPDSFLLDPYIQRLRRDDAADTAILVVDDCLRTNPNELARRIEPIKDRVQIVTLSFDRPTEQRDHYVELLPINSDGIQEIIESYLTTGHRGADGLAAFCNGSARYAHIAGKAAGDDSSILEVSDGSDLAERIIPCGALRNSELARSRLTIARFLSLFERFGFASPFEVEIREIAKVIRRFHPSIGLGDVLDAVKTLHQARILQGRATYYFATPLMAEELWASWWDLYGDQWKELKATRLTGHLFDTWLQQLRTVQPSPVSTHIAARIVEWLGTQSVLRTRSYASRGVATDTDEQVRQRNQELLNGIFDLAPKESLTLLERQLRWSEANDKACRSICDSLAFFESAILKQTSNSDLAIEAIELLWKIEVGRDIEVCDRHRAHLLGKLLAWNSGRKRLPQFYSRMVSFLKTITSSGSDHNRTIGLFVLLHAIIETNNREKEAGEYVDALWKIMANAIKPLEHVSEAEVIFELLANCIRLFFAFPDYADAWVDELAWMTEKPLENKMRLLHGIESIWVHPHEFFRKARPRLTMKRLYESLIGKHEAKKAEMVLLTHANSYEAEDDEELERLFPRREILKKVCQDITSLPASFEQLLVKAICGDVSQFATGMCLSQLDTDRSAFCFILDLYNRNRENARIGFLTGYIAGVHEINVEESQELTAEVLKLDLTKHSRLELCAYLNASVEELETELIAVAEDGVAHRRELWRISTEQIHTMSETGILEAIDAFAKQNTIVGLVSASWLFHKRFESATNVSSSAQASLRKLILSDVLYNPIDRQDRSYINLHDWEQCFRINLTLEPDGAADFLRRYWNHYVNGSRHSNDAIDSATDAAELVLEHTPELFWNEYFKQLEACQSKEQQVCLIAWLSSEHDGDIEAHAGSWGLVPKDRLFKWADTDPDVRAGIIASRIPPLIIAGSITPVSRDFLLRYGSQNPNYEERLRGRQFGFSIPSVDQINSALMAASDIRDEEDEPDMIAILEREIKHLSQFLERTKVKTEIAQERALR